MYARINPVKFGLAGAIIWGLTLFLLTWISKYTGYGMFWLSQWMDVYPGFDLTALGTFIGLAYGLVIGFIGSFLLAALYNLFKP